jgi:predicted MFS family arabinose efflux permease
MSPRDTAAAPSAAAAAPRMTPEELRQAFFLVFPSVVVSIVIGAIDQTIVATALPAIAGRFGVVEGISWVVVAYLIAATVAAPVYGRLGDVFGLKRLLLVALVFTLASAAVAAAAPSFGWLMVGRVLQGVGGGGLTTLTMAVIGEAIPPRERGRFQAWIAGSFVLASSLGPVAGGWLTEALGWRAVFWVQVPATLLAFALALRLPRRERAGSRSAGFRFDLPGAVLFGAFVAPALLALSQLRALSLDSVLPALVLAGFALLAGWMLVRRERRASDPLLPLPMLAEPTILRADLFTACGHGATVALVTFLPIYLQSVRGLSPAEVGLLLLPLSVGGGIGGLTAGRLMTATGLATPLAGAGLALGAVALVAASLLAPALPVWWLALLFGVAAMGLGCSYPVSQIVVQVAGGPARLGAAAASVQYARTLGAAVATTLTGGVLFGALTLADPEAGALFARMVREGPAALLPTLGEGARAALQAALSEAFRLGFAVVAAMAAAGSVLAWRVPVRRV